MNIMNIGAQTLVSQRFMSSIFLGGITPLTPQACIINLRLLGH